MRFEAVAPVARRRRGTRAFEALLTFGALVVWSDKSYLLSVIPWLSPSHLLLAPFGLCLALPLLHWVTNWKRKRRVLVDAGGIALDGATFLDRATIVNAYCAPANDGSCMVHVGAGVLGPTCTVYLDSEAKGRELLAALRLGVASFRALHPWVNPARWLAVPLSFLLLLLLRLLLVMGFWGGTDSHPFLVSVAGVASLAFLSFFLLMPMFLTQRIDVGHDGVFLGGLFRRRFLPFADLEGVTMGIGQSVKLALRGGRRVGIHFQDQDGAERQAAAFYERTREGIAAHAGLAGADEAALARGGRDLEAWVGAMRALGASQGGGYRAQAISRERLWQIVESPGADPSVREGAAIALSAALDEGERERIATVAHATAQPRLRVALEGVSRERDEGRLRVALAEAEGELDEPASEGAARRRLGR